MAITWVWGADSFPNGTRSHANFPTQYKPPEVSSRRNSRRYRFGRLPAVQVHGAPQEIKATHYRTLRKICPNEEAPQGMDSRVRTNAKQGRTEGQAGGANDKRPEAWQKESR